MNKILDYIIEQRGGHYVHALELDSAYAYEQVISQFLYEYRDEFSRKDFIDFFKSIDLYYYIANKDDSDMLSDYDKEVMEEELHNFDYEQFIIDNY